MAVKLQSLHSRLIQIQKETLALNNKSTINLIYVI